jgi:hypothetical protein
MSQDHDDQHVASHSEPAEDHADAGSHGHGHEEDGEPLGPPDLAAWGYAISGGLLGLVTALALYAAARG